MDGRLHARSSLCTPGPGQSLACCSTSSTPTGRATMGGLDTGRLRLCSMETGVAMFVGCGLCMAKHGYMYLQMSLLFPFRFSLFSRSLDLYISKRRNLHILCLGYQAFFSFSFLCLFPYFLGFVCYLCGNLLLHGINLQLLFTSVRSNPPILARISYPKYTSSQGCPLEQDP